MSAENLSGLISDTRLLGRVAALYRHPVKGFTPEALAQAKLAAGQHFPCDRRYAIELGPSGYDPRHPVYLKKTSFAVLANRPKLAGLRTSFDERMSVLTVAPPLARVFTAELDDPDGRESFAAWVTDFLGDVAPERPLRVIEAVDGFRFMDDANGHVSMINLASLRHLETQLKEPLDPLRFRANIYVEGWSAWAELSLTPDAEIRLGPLRLRVVKPIKRCIATHVNTSSGVRDLDVVPALMRAYGHPFCGLYLSVLSDGVITLEDPVEVVLRA